MIGFGLSALLAVAGSCTSTETLPVVVKAPVESMLLAALQAHGSSVVVVTLPAENASPTDVVLAYSSGDSMVDAAALDAARHTVFAPETNDCAPIAGRYFYQVDV
jgi:outer membrane biosynthesis protein TonB